MSRKYYYLKLHKDFFKRHDLKLIRKMPQGDSIALFYLMLLTESIDHEGMLRIDEYIPYDVETLAIVFDFEPAFIQMALQVLSTYNMLEILEDKTMFMTKIDAMLGKESKSTERVRKHREQQKITQQKADETQCNVSCNKNVTPYKSKSKSIEIDKELEIEIEIKNYLIYIQKMLEKYNFSVSKEMLEKLHEGIKTNINVEADEKTKKAYIEKSIVNLKVKIELPLVFDACKEEISKRYTNASKRFSSKSAKEKIEVALKNKAKADDIIKGYKNYLNDNEETDLQHIKNFTTFMNQEVWKDYLEIEQEPEIEHFGKVLR